MKPRLLTVDQILGMRTATLACLIIDEQINETVVRVVLQEFAQGERWADVKNFLMIYEETIKQERSFA